MTIKLQKSSSGLWSRWQRSDVLAMQTRAKRCWLRCANLWETAGYRKLIKVLERQTCVICTKEEKAVNRALPSAYFSDLEERISRNRVWAENQEAVDHDQSAVLDKNRCVSAGKAENVRVLLRFLGPVFWSPRLRAESVGHWEQLHRHLCWAAWVHRSQGVTCRMWGNKVTVAWMQGLLKHECERRRMIALCAKCCYVDEDDSLAAPSVCRSKRSAPVSAITK